MCHEIRKYEPTISENDTKLGDTDLSRVNVCDVQTTNKSYGAEKGQAVSVLLPPWSVEHKRREDVIGIVPGVPCGEGRE